MAHPVSLRLAYGLGLGAEGVKNNAFGAFLLLYYQQVLGLDARLAGLALFCALCVDAVTDPLVGAWSDGLRSRLGRRHPFLYAAILPTSACHAMVFMPPAGLQGSGLFAWLLVFAVGTRVGMTLFVVPHAALGAELATGYDERASWMSTRAAFGWGFGLVHALVAYTVFFVSTPEYAWGLLNPAAWRSMALFGSSLIVLMMVVSAVSTQPAARALELPARPVLFRELLGAVRLAWSLRAYRAVVLGGIGLAVAFGVSEALANYLNTWFWGLPSEKLGLFVLAILASTLGVAALAGPAVARFGKRAVAIGGVVVGIGALQGSVAARLVGLMPANDDPALMPVLMVVVFVGYGGFIMAMAMLGAMIADCTDAFRVASGESREGLLFAANTLTSKALSGLGVFVSGWILALVGLEAGADPATVAPEVVWRLGAASVGLQVVMGVLTVLALSRYDLDRSAHSALGAVGD